MVQSIPVTDAVQDRHVEQIIISGSPFISSMYGSEAHLVTAPSVPLFYGAPIITGSLLRLSTLLCSEGAFHSSPRAVATYQWKKDNVDIGGETTNSYTTVTGDIDAVITCLVTATNASGNDSLISNGVTIEDLIPSSVFEFDVFITNGFSNGPTAHMNDTFIGIVSCFAHNDKIDVNEAEVYAVTALQSLEKVDVNEADAYVVFTPVFVSDLIVLNGDAENVSMSDWTIDFGGVTSVTSAPAQSNADQTTNREGLRFFMPEELGQGVDSQMSQVIAIDAGDYTLVDEGRCYVVTSLIHQSKEGIDHLEITMEALNAAMEIIGTETTIVPVNPQGTPNNVEAWMRETTINEILSLPTLTRHVKLIVLFKAHDTLGGSNTVYADDFKIQLLEIE